MISIINAVQSSWIFIAIFAVLLLLSLQRGKDQAWFPLSLTQELKGFAILAVIFSHLGFFLISDHRFLFPLSIMAGVGVNLFLFLSGYGLTIGALRNEISIGQFYRRRLVKILIPLWLVLAIFLSLDFFVLKIGYDWQFIAKALVGFFPSADLYRDLNSPLWYLTLIIFYYLLFPLVFIRKQPWISAAILYLIAYLVIKINPEMLRQVMHLYEVHILAFPIGIIAGWILFEPYWLNRLIPDKWEAFLDSIKEPAWLFNLIQFFKKENSLHKISKRLKGFSYYLLVIMLLAVICYSAYYSNVGAGAFKEQLTSIITMLAIILLFIIKKFEFKLLYIFGLYSYEIYLLHWPIVYRYDVYFRFLPAWLATIVYLAVCLILGYFLKKIVDYLISGRKIS